MDDVLRDGGSIHIRSIGPDDKRRLLDHFNRLGPESVRFRFFGAKKTLTPAELVQLTELDFVKRVGLVATLRDGSGERIVGVGRYIATDVPGRAEVAFAVDDAHQGHGVGTLLLTHLVGIARGAGITEFEADVLDDNNRMLGVFAATGLVATRSVEAGVVHVAFATEETERSREAGIGRERLAAARSVRAFFVPRSIAVIGASRRPAAMGNVLLRRLKEAGFAGALHPVNPRADAVEGLRAFPSVGAIGSAVDLALVAVPTSAVESVVAECAAAGVHGVIVVSAGFGEMAGEGRAAEARLREAVRGSGMRLVGPNAMGVINTDPAVRLNATLAHALPPAGRVAMMSQSGALGLALLDHAGRLDIGISSFASVGNKADVSGNDLMCYWADDPQTEVILLYLESFGNPRRFARLAPLVARCKPVVAVKAGRSRAGRRAAASHSAARGSPDDAVEALFEQAGVIRTDTLQELFEVTALLSSQPVPRGPRVGVITNAGGPGTLAADACEAAGLVLPEPSPETVTGLRAFLPAEAGVSNPVDMLATASADDYLRAMRALGADDAIDALVVIHSPLLEDRSEAVARAITEGAVAVAGRKPVVAVLLSDRDRLLGLASDPGNRIPCYAYPESAARALGAAAWYGRWRRRPQGSVLELDSSARSAIRAVVERVLERAGGAGWLEAADVATVLHAAGIHLASQPDQVRPGIDARVAVTSDPTFGPLVVCALGGALAELAHDLSFRLPPVSDLEAADMVDRLRGRPLLDGYRGGPSGDRAALQSLVQRVSALVDTVPELLELELDPVRVLPPGGGALVLDARIRVGASGAEPSLPAPAAASFPEVEHV